MNQTTDSPSAPSPDLTSSARDRLLEDAVAIQNRFAAEPLLKTSGVGGLKSGGVEQLRKDAKQLELRYGKHR